ncbi:IPT/TIG domain-containing protein [Actinoplanes teichomyceticus]|nr:IPT/TIG domain-containing protein [Actinoplanes teichomyceticus]GIF11855.1 hypothetical protein Ate01nite_18870 [Actinoplanes teichomyceticus]
MAKTPRARRATAAAATAVAVIGSVAITLVPPSAAYSATGAVRAVVAAAPVVTGISPSTGPLGGGTPVVVLGSGFSTLDPGDPRAVTFGDVPAERFVVVTDTKLVATTPAGAGTVPVKVTGSGGAARTAPAFGFRMELTAAFDGLAARATGGTEIPVEVGGGTAGATAAAFAALKITARVGGLPAKATWVDPTHLRVTAPATSRTTPAAVQLVHDGYAGPESTSKVGYFPVVTAVTPGSIRVEGGEAIRITGAGFLSVDESDPEAVTVGGVAVTAFSVNSATQIEAVLPPAAAGAATVRVTTPDAASPAEGPAVTYRGVLAVDGSGDQFLRAAGGAHVLTVTGGTLGATAREYAAMPVTVQLGAARLMAAYVDPTHLRVPVPALRTETAELRLVQDRIAGPATTLPVGAVVTSLSASSSPLAGGRTVQVRVAGLGADEASGFTFGATPATCEKGAAATSPMFVCTVPAAAQAGPVPVRFTTGGGTASRFTAAATFTYTDID